VALFHYVRVAAICACAWPYGAWAADQDRVDALERKLHEAQSQLAQIKAARNSNDGAALKELQRGSTAQYARVKQRLDAQPRVGLDNGRLSVTSADGAFSMALRGTVQFDAAYFARVDAIQFTIAHDDGIAWEDWEQADIVLAGVSRSSKTPTSIYLANRGFKVANVPLVPESPPPATLYDLKHPMIIGLTTNIERLIQIRRNRLLSLNQAPETDYVDMDAVNAELAFARRMFADNGWPVIDVTRRSIEETALAIVKLCAERSEKAAE